MIANGRRRHQHPSPWCRCHTFLHYLGILINGKSSISFQRIQAFEGRDEAIACENAWKKREEEDMKKAEKKADLERELQEHGDENIHTQVQMGIPLDLLERLGRYQGYIGSEYKVSYCFLICFLSDLIVIDSRRLSIFSAIKDNSFMGRKHPLVLDIGNFSGFRLNFFASSLGIHTYLVRTYNCLRAFWTTDETSRSVA
jgi:hypothetical protein